MPRPFLLVADELALDFVNTVVWDDGRVDLLVCESDLWRWAEAVGVAIDDPSAPETDLPERVRTLRADLRTLFLAAIAGDEPAAESVARVDRAARCRPAVTVVGGLYRRSAVHDIDSMLAEVAHAALAVLMGSDRARLRRCQGHDCILLFLDRSRAQRRRWCSMELCGNRAKAAAWRRRQ